MVAVDTSERAHVIDVRSSEELEVTCSVGHVLDHSLIPVWGFFGNDSPWNDYFTTYDFAKTVLRLNL